MQKADAIWSINPYKLAENSASTERCLAVSQLPRLVEFLACDEGEIYAHIAGRVDEDHRKLLVCSLKGTVMMECQTTFQVIPVELVREVTFYPVLTEEMIAAAPEEYEAFLFDTDELDLINLIEDELILSLPIAVSSEDSPVRLTFGPEVIEQEEKKPNPFAVLAALKKDSAN
jgi:uncharacterized protein